MFNKSINLVGYHGTKRDLRIDIERDGFTVSKSGWLGKGIYFFQEDYDMALNWAKKRHGTLMVCFIKRNINIEDERFFDITWPLDPRAKYFFSERETFVKEMEQRGFAVEVESKKRFEGALVDQICYKKNYDVARACTYTYQQYDEIYKLNSIFANGVEICVKKIECMKVG